LIFPRQRPEQSAYLRPAALRCLLECDSGT
jgi:hypothetical protein